MKVVTLREFVRFGPCYSFEQLRHIARKRVYWNALDIILLTDIPVHDRLWAVMRPELIDEGLCIEYLCRVVEHIATHYNSIRSNMLVEAIALTRIANAGNTIHESKIAWHKEYRHIYAQSNHSLSRVYEMCSCLLALSKTPRYRDYSAVYLSALYLINYLAWANLSYDGSDEHLYYSPSKSDIYKSEELLINILKELIISEAQEQTDPMA